MPNWRKVAVSGSDASFSTVFATNGITGSFTGSLDNLQGTSTHIPFFSSSQVLADSTIFQVDNGPGQGFSIAINQNAVTTANPEALFVSQLSTSSFNIISGKGNLNNYTQLNIFNSNAGTSASADVVATANNGDESTNYIDMGINNENFIGPIGIGNDAYLYSTGRHLHIGNATNNPVVLFAGGTDTDVNRKLQIDPNNLHELTGSLDISGSLIVQHGITGSLYGSASYALTASYALNGGSGGGGGAVYVEDQGNNQGTASYFNFTGTGVTSSVSNGTASISIPGQIITGSNAILVQTTPATTWSFVHNLGEQFPVFTIFDSSNNVIMPFNIHADSVYEATIYWSSPATGTAVAANCGLSGSIPFVTASYAISSSNALTASYVANASSFPFTGSAVISGSLTITGSFNITGSTLQTGNNTLIGNTILSGSVSISGSQVFTGTSVSIGNQIVTGSLITSGSNILIGNAVLSGSINISGSSTINGLTSMTGSLAVTGSTVQIGNNTLLGNTLLSGSLTISGSSLDPQYTSVDIYGNTDMTGYLRFLSQSVDIDTAVSGAYIYVSGSTNDLYFAQNNKGYANTTRLRWIEGNMYTGLLNGGIITSQSSTVYQVGSGSGIIVSLNASLNDNPYPTIQYLNWNNLSASIAPLTSSYDQAFVGISSNGQIYQQGDPFNGIQFNALINTGLVLFQNRSTINGFKTQPSTAYGFPQSQNIFNRAFGPLKLSGFTLAPSGSSTGSLVVGSGTAYAPGSSYITDPNNPSYAIDPGTNTSKIWRYYDSGSGWVYDTNGGAGYATIDPTRYSLNGVLTAVPGTGINREWTNQRTYWFPNSAAKAIVVYYGNQPYATELEAIANINIEPFVEAPNTAANAIYLGTITVRNNADFTDVDSFKIAPGGLFRQVGGSGGGGSVVTQTLTGLSDVAIAGPTDLQPFVYSTTTAKWINSSAISASVAGNATSATSASYTATASYVDPLNQDVVITGSLTVTGSQTFIGTSVSIGTQTVTGSLTTSGSNTLIGDTILSGSVSISGSQFFTGTSTSIGDQIVTGSLTTSGSNTLIGDTILSGSIAISGSQIFTGLAISIGDQIITGSLVVSGSQTFIGTSTSIGTQIVTGSLTTSGSSILIGDTVLSGSVSISGSQIFTGTSVSIGNQIVTGSLSTSGSNTLIGDTILSGSIAISGSQIFTGTSEFIGNQATTGSLTISGSLTVSGVSNLTASNAVSSSYAVTASYAIGSFPYTGTAVISGSLVVTSTIVLDGTLNDYYTVASSTVGSNNLFTQVTGSYTSAYFKYTVSNSTNARAGEVMAVWNGATTNYTDTSTTDIGSTSAVTCSAIVVGGDIQFNITTGTSGWKLKSLATFM
jgi:hypothetical protein